MSIKAYEHKAQYYETDQMAIVHHSNYIRWFESARIDFMGQMGISYKTMEESGIISPVLAVSCEYKSMVHFDDEVLIVPSIQSYNGVKLCISYVITDKKTGELRTTGESRHCFLNKEGRPISLKKEAPVFHELFMKYTPTDK